MKKKKKKLPIPTLCLYIILIAFFCSLGFIYYFKTKLGPGLIECAENEVKRMTNLVMNNCLKKYLSTNQVGEILEFVRNNDNSIQLIRYNTKEVNQMKVQITSLLEDDLSNMAKGNFEQINLNLNNISDDYYSKINDGIIFTVSVGSATGNSLLSNLGPKIPLDLALVEEVTTDVNTKITEYGLNNAMVEVFIRLEATTVIHMPFLSKQVHVSTDIPITMELVQGSIPDYYPNNN